MIVKRIHPTVKMPALGSDGAAAYDLFMPTDGEVEYGDACGVLYGLGFAMRVPDGCGAFIIPRSGVGSKNGLSINNTVGLIDPDYRGEVMASFRLRNYGVFQWKAGDRLLQMFVAPLVRTEVRVVDSLDDTERGDGKFGSTGK